MSFEIEITSDQLKDTIYRVHIKVINVSDERCSGIVNLQPPFQANPNHSVQWFLENILPKQIVEYNFDYKISSGGTHVFYAWTRGAKLDSLISHHIKKSGPGYYSGDTHSHSTYSDGKGSLRDNRASMIRKGHRFLISTDHNTMDHYEEISEYKISTEDFLHISDYEFTTNYGHAIPYNVYEMYDSKNITKRDNVEQWQNFVDFNNQPTFIYLAHPYEAPCYEFGTNVLENIQGITGIEVWNGYNHHALSYQNQKSFKLWDKLNLKGEGKCFGNAVSDAHTITKQGNPFIKGYLGKLSEEEVYRLLETGAYYGSNGPELKFEIDGVSIGGTVNIENEMQYAPLKLQVFEPLHTLEYITIYKGNVYFDKKFEKIYEEFLLTENEKNLKNVELIIPIQKGDIYRVEVIAEIGVVSLCAENKFYDRGFAFSNPIWIK